MGIAMMHSRLRMLNSEAQLLTSGLVLWSIVSVQRATHTKKVFRLDRTNKELEIIHDRVLVHASIREAPPKVSVLIMDDESKLMALEAGEKVP